MAAYVVCYFQSPAVYEAQEEYKTIVVGKVVSMSKQMKENSDQSQTKQ